MARLRGLCFIIKKFALLAHPHLFSCWFPGRFRLYNLLSLFPYCVGSAQHVFSFQSVISAIKVQAALLSYAYYLLLRKPCIISSLVFHYFFVPPHAFGIPTHHAFTKMIFIICPYNAITFYSSSRHWRNFKSSPYIFVPYSFLSYHKSIST